MTKRYNILNLLLSALVLLLPSCISLEDYETDADRSKTIEFVCRPTSYDGQEVLTKATTVDDFENKVHNCYFMLYNNSGTRVYGPVDLNATLATQRFSKSEFKLNVGELATYTACFVANVSKSIVDGLNTLTKVNSTVLDIAYSSADVSDTDNRYKPSSFVVPEFVLEDDGEAVQCLPMFGMQECNVAADDIFQISLKRLFAKVTVSVGLGSLTSSFDVMAAHLFNLPTKVKLSESSNESEWVEDVSSFLQQQIEGPIGHQITSSLSSAYELYFYVPEYYLNGRDDRSGNYGNEKFKPNMYDTDKNPVLFRLFGEYGRLIGGDTGVQYDLYLGENAATSFTLKRNKHYINSMVINGITNRIDGSGNTLDCRVTVSEEGLDEVEIIGQTANCYIIGKTGSYIYPACKGVHKGGLKNIPDNLKCTKGTTLKILYNDNSANQLANLAYNQESGEFSFDVTRMDTGTGALASNDGNLILGLVYDEGGVEKIEWSWHLWFINGAVWGVDAFEISTQNYPNTSVMMDRNLGSKPLLSQKSNPGIAYGLYYRYGRKEPFLNGDYLGGGESENNVYTWDGDDKSQTDPCPPGYRVPKSDVWQAGSNGQEPEVKHYSSLTAGDAFEFWDNVYYPYSGYVDENKVIQNQGYGTRQTTEGYSVNIPNNQTNLSTLSNEILNYFGPIKFTNVTYSKYNIHNLGVTGARDNELRYSFIEKGTDIISCTVQVGSWKRSGSLFSGYKYNAEYKNAAVTLTGDQLKSNYSDAYNRLISVLNGKSGSNTDILGDLIGSYFTSPVAAYEISSIASTSYGYTVRCVKE